MSKGRTLTAARKLVCRLRSSERGAVAVEFALIMPVLLMFVIGGLEIGYRIYAIAVVNGSLREASRMAATGQYTGAQIDAKVSDTIKAFRDSANVTIVKKSYSNFTGVGLPEPVTTGTVASGKYCYQDINANGRWDSDQGVSGLGGPEDVIYYEVKMTYPTLMPFSQNMFGMGSTVTVTQNTIVSNEPYAAVARITPSTRCVG